MRGSGTAKAVVRPLNGARPVRELAGEELRKIPPEAPADRRSPTVPSAFIMRLILPTSMYRRWAST